MSNHRSFYELTEEVADLRRQVARLVGLIQQPPDADRSIAGFCRRKGISRAFFYKLQKRGRAPRVGHAGARRIITAEAEADWDRACEAEGAQASAALHPRALRVTP